MVTVQPLDVAIIGAGTAGLSARSEVAKVTDRYRVFDPGPYGTTCAHTACMPSKAFLQSAHDYFRRRDFDRLGIRGAEALRVDGAAVLAETRRLRDSLVKGVVEGMESWRDTHLVPHAPTFGADGVLRAGDLRFQPRATIVATGSRPVVPEGWRDMLGADVITSEQVFEMEALPRRMAVFGLGPVGLELGQALARLGVQVTGFDPSPALGGLVDPELRSSLRSLLEPEMTLVQARAEPLGRVGGSIRIRWDGGETEVNCVLAATGRRPGLGGLGLDRIGVDLSEEGRPVLPEGQLNLPGARVYFAGDAGNGPGLLHEASDEGRVAGYFAARGEDARFRRRQPLRMVFCEPQIALAGATWDEVRASGEDMVTGEASFDGAGRTFLQRRGGGPLRVYARRSDGRILGAAILAHEAEHLAHLLCYAIDRGDDLRGLLRMPAYHPTHEEVLRRALRDALAKCDAGQDELETIRCADAPVDRPDAADPP